MVAFLPAHLPADFAKLDRPMIESPGLVTLDHSLCMYSKTIWSSLTHTLL